MPGVCPRCHREVYFAEERLAVGKVWHSLCFTCRNCRKLLDSCTVATHRGELFCRNCCNRLFPPTWRAKEPGKSAATLISTRDSFPDNCCCCCAEGDRPSKNNRDFAKGRLRGGGGEEEVNDRSQHCDNRSIGEKELEASRANASGSVASDQPFNSTAIITWYNRRGSTSQREKENLKVSNASVSELEEICVDSSKANCAEGKRSASRSRDERRQLQLSVSKRKCTCEAVRSTAMQNERNRLKVLDSRPMAATRKHRYDMWRAEDVIEQNDHGHRNTRDSNSNDTSSNRTSVTNDSHNVVHENILDPTNIVDMIAEREQQTHQLDRTGKIHQYISSCQTDRRPEPIHVPNTSADKNANTSGSNDDSPSDKDTFKSALSTFCESDPSERTRGGCGGTDVCCESVPCRCGKNTCGELADYGCPTRGGILKAQNHRSTALELCPSRASDSRQNDLPTLCNKTCAPPCAARRGCCLPSGCRPVCRPVCRKAPSCRTPCTGDSRTCGGGGCCGSGCRGGCGKPGQICMPSRPCTTPPCKPCAPCASPCPVQNACPPPSCRGASRVAMVSGGGGPSCCRPRSPRCRTPVGRSCCVADERTACDGVGCCRQKLPPGCECLGGGLDCQRCGRKVYQAEMQIASGVPYHNICFSCYCCRKPLEPLNYQENCGEIYCKQCYVRNFGPQGYGYGVGAGVLQTPM